MRKIMKQIEKNLDKNLSKSEKKELLIYYEEIINDRIENGESIESVRKSFTNANITNDLEFTKSSKGKFNWWLLLLVPILLILAIITFSLLIAVVSIIFAISVTMFVLLIASLIYIIEVIITNPGLPLILFVTGIGLFIASGTILLFKPVYKLMKICFEYLKLGFKGIITKTKAFIGGL